MRKRILLVDDNRTFREWVRNNLIQHGYEVVEADDGDLALKLFPTILPLMAVVTDTNMPRVDGIELLMSLRRLDPVLPIVVFFNGLSGYSMEKKHVLALGATAVLTKDEEPTLYPLLAKV